MTGPRWRRGRRNALGLAGTLLALIALIALAACGGSAEETVTSATPTPADAGGTAATVTFVELGSDKCIPCKEMRPVMDSIQATFGDQIEIVFYDVWEDPTPAEVYGIQMIPTQVFLDEDGKEFHRHVGFYPEQEIEAVLVEHGLTKLTTP